MIFLLFLHTHQIIIRRDRGIEADNTGPAAPYLLHISKKSRNDESLSLFHDSSKYDES